ncbi:TRAP transporter small permease [Thermoanaerobacterium sp. DL9XJH110]|uniref:TRAP transporter small permease n=1 Tax=Thermoanaerobacterium sp. DL9XJH110 TaxID=3386643 RepID=UPI003BB4E5B3
MLKIKHLIDKLLEFISMVNMLGMIIVVSIQIICRYSPLKAPQWTEEASRFLFIFAVSFAGSLAIRDNAFANVDLFITMFPKMSKIIKIVCYSILEIFMIILLPQSIRLIQLGSIQTSPSLGLLMSIPFSSIFIFTVFACFYICIEIYDSIIKKGVPS